MIYEELTKIIGRSAPRPTKIAFTDTPERALAMVGAVGWALMLYHGTLE